MMIRAYNELYLNDAKITLANMFDYGINDLKMKSDWLASLFVTTGYAEKFESGNPSVISGMSGQELARAIVEKVYKEREFPSPKTKEGCSPEYWAGWALAEYQWYSGKTFKDIFERISMTEIIDMYKLYHEMDISQFIENMDKQYSAVELETKLKKIRESRNISQSELADLSGVKIRSIQMYEQRANDIDKAQAATLYKLSRVLGCSIEALLENPMQ